MKPFTWTLAVSTLWSPERKVEQFLELNAVALEKFFDEVLVVMQVRDPGTSFFMGAGKRRLRLLISPGVGISASRNLAIEAFTTDAIWFMDDDVLLEVGNLQKIKESVAQSPSPINCVRMADPRSGVLVKRYGSERTLSRLGVLKVSSIEIIVRREVFMKEQLRFPEEFGLGSDLPGGEENLFLKRAIEQGLSVRHVPEVGCRHPVEKEEIVRHWNRPNKTRAMGVVAREYRAVGALLCLRWSLRALRLGVSNSSIRDLWRGFLQGR